MQISIYTLATHDNYVVCMYVYPVIEIAMNQR